MAWGSARTEGEVAIKVEGKGKLVMYLGNVNPTREGYEGAGEGPLPGIY